MSFFVQPPTNAPFRRWEVGEEIFYPETEIHLQGETSFHSKTVIYLWQTLNYFFQPRKDVLVAANLLIYPDRENQYDFYAPDVMICFGAGNYERQVYKVWRERIFPQIIIEVASDLSWQEDIKTKRREYENSGVQEYYVFDPEYQYLQSPLLSFHRKSDYLNEISVENNRIYSPLLGLELVDSGDGLRLFNPQTGKFLPDYAELAQTEKRAEKAEAEIERLKAELAKLKNG